MKAERDIKYLNKDFSSLRTELIEYAKNYFPDTYTDFTAASPGMMFMEMAAYVGDILSFYQDTQIQETFLQYAKNPTSLYAMAYMMGYRPKVTTVAEVDITVSQTVDAQLSGSEYIPSWSQAYVLGEGSEIKSDTAPSVSFLTKDTVDFSYSSSTDPTVVTANFGTRSTTPSSFTLSKTVKAYSGQIKEFSKTFGTYKKFQTITLEDTNIVGIVSATDNSTDDESNAWTEVPFLGQDTVFTDQEISGDGTQYVLQLKEVPKRFVTRFNTNGGLDIQFGAGVYASDVSESAYIPNPLNLENPQEFSSDKYDVAYDPSNFLFSKSYGLCPTNTTITFKYITGGGVESNVPANTITQPGNIYLKCKYSSEAADINNISFNNEYAATGGRDGDTLEEIRQNALRSFAEQKRLVTLKDFNIRALAMPAKYGSVAKVYATVASNGIVDLYVLSYDINGHLVEMSDDIKSNLKTYLSEYLMLTDKVNIKDAYVVNIGVRYDIVMKPNYDSTETLRLCSQAVEEFFRVENRSINEAINLTELYNRLDEIKGVQVVKNIEIVNRYGEDNGYSKYSYNIVSAQRNNTIYPSYDPCIFELKYPESDIEGRVVSL